jgi:glycosyltransferase involved in cell wall biosynthesis
LYYSATNSCGRILAQDPKVDWVEKKHLADFAQSAISHEAHPGSEPPRYSFVIPFRDRESTLPFVLNGLLNQDSSAAFEIILVDDGSAAPLAPSIRAQLHGMSGGWSAVRLPPSKLFRAGFARNMGALTARGETLVFLDSDIIVPPTYLRQIEVELQTADFVQARRWQVWRDQWTAADPHLPWNTEQQRWDEPNAYWNDFQLSREPWMKKSQPWRYVSSNCLAVPRQAFLAWGGFRHWYTDYGFEDTDLGIRAWRNGAHLHLSKNSVFHLAPVDRGTWMAIPQVMRNSLLRKNARKFLLINQAIDSLEWMARLIL